MNAVELVLVVAAAGLLACLAVASLARGRDPVADGGRAVDSLVPARITTPPGVLRVFTTVNHRDIGLLYLVFGAGAALWGGTDAMMLRTELLTAGPTIWNVDTYNALFTTHGVTMLFFFVTPVFVGIGNYFLPLLVGAEDMAFPRINAIAFWLLPPSLLLVRGGLVTEILGKLIALVGPAVGGLFALEPFATGWTFYTPLSVQLTNQQIDLALLGLHLSGVATTMAAINFLVTVFAEREMDWADLDIFTWSLLTTSALILFAFPLLGAALVMLLLDRNFGTTFFAVEGGGPLLWQHLFWFFGHPEVYILVLPAFGLTSLILPKFAGRKLFGFKFVVYSTLAIGVLSFGVWAHHMFTTGTDPRVLASFMAVSLAIAVPSAVKVFNWITTMWNGRVRLTAPMVLLVGGIALFVVGGVTGVFLASIPVDLVLHDTYYVVGHFHLIIMGIIPMTMFAASYYWYPLVTGRWYDRRLALLHAVLTVVGSLVTFVPLLLLGYEGLPRRYATYPAQFEPLQQVATVGAYLIGTGVVVWVYNVVQSYRVGPPVEDGDPWNLAETGQLTREWQWFADRLDRRDDGE